MWAYSYANAKLSVPSDIVHRHFRVRIGDEWVKLPRIHSIDELRNILVNLQPDAVYMSVSTWLNPELLGSRHENKAGYPILANCLLSSDFIADFDEESTPSDYCKALIYLKQAGFSEFTHAITYRGAHLWVTDFYNKRCVKHIPSVHNRIKYIQSQRKILADELVKAGVVFDHKISADPYRVARLWGSLHDDKQIVCTAYTDFSQFITDYTLRHRQKLREGATHFRPPRINVLNADTVRPMTHKCSKVAEPDPEVKGYSSDLAGVELTYHPYINKQLDVNSYVGA